MTADAAEDLVCEVLNRAPRYPGVAEIEPVLMSLLDELSRPDADRQRATLVLQRLIEEWPPGALEIIEFTMHRLRWPEVKVALERQAADLAVDFRLRDQARHALRAFEDEWPDGEVYTTYAGRLD
jgi:hypothetical protein